MKTHGLKSAVMMAWIVGGWWTAHAQAPTVAPTAVNFSYQMGASPLLQQQKVVVTLPKAIATQTVNVTNVVVAMSQTVGTNLCSQPASGSNTACGWLSVTPTLGASPLTVTVTANPSSLTAGSYSGSFTVANSTAPINPQQVNVILSISNPPSTLSVTDSAGNPITSLSFSFSTDGDPTAVTPAEIDVSSTGDIIPFTVTAANAGAKGSSTAAVWSRVRLGSGLPATTASSSAFPGSIVKIAVFLDPTTLVTLDPAGSPYNGTITVAAVNAVNGVRTVPVTLNVTAGTPQLQSVFPQSVNAMLPGTTATNNFIFTLAGQNFFTTSAVSLQEGICESGTIISTVGPTYPLPQPTYLSRQVLQVAVNPAYFTESPTISPIGEWFLKVGNPVAATNPALTTTCAGFTVVDPMMPTISGVVNAASYQPASAFAGVAPGTDPLAAVGVSTSAVSPREIVSIFGQNLGPSTPSTAQPQPATCAGDTPGSTYCSAYLSTGPITVTFTYTDPVLGPQPFNAPILMTSLNQVNAIVPQELSAYLGQQVTVSVTNSLGATPVSPQIPFTVTVLQENPGIFSFGGLGQGQGAIIDYDSSGNTSVNSTKNAEPRGDTVLIYVTGMGELLNTSPLTGQIVTDATNPVADTTVRVDIGGQPCVISYAGTAQGTVAGLVQINAVVPPNAKTGTVPIAVSIGSTTTARTSQSGVTITVK